MNFSDLHTALGHNPGMVLALILGLAGMFTLLLLVLGTQAIVQWRIYRQMDQELEFKRELLASGFSPEEIEKVILTTSPKSQSRFVRCRHPWKSRVAMDNALSRRVV